MTTLKKHRRPFLAALFALFVFVASLTSFAADAGGGGRCEFIKDHDKRHLCRAISEKNPSWCEFIKDKDTKNFCRATVKKLPPWGYDEDMSKKIRQLTKKDFQEIAAATLSNAKAEIDIIERGTEIEAYDNLMSEIAGHDPILADLLKTRTAASLAEHKKIVRHLSSRLEN